VSGGGAAGDGRPRLVAVPPPDEHPAPASAGVAKGGGALVWVLAAALVLAAFGLVALSRRAAGLESRLADTEARLRAAEARMAAYDAYLGAVRERVGALRAPLDRLEGVLAADPAEGAPRE
jgi:hypothetical protein